MKAKKVKGLDPDGTFADNGRRIVQVRVDELYALAPKALDPERPKKLHDLRIAAKRLRYVLEVTRPALGKGAGDGVRTMKSLQDLLGTIRDSDEMLARVRAHAAEVPPGDRRHRGLDALTGRLAARRAVHFARFEREWAKLEARDFRGTLLAAISPGQPAAPAPKDEAEA